LYYFVSLLASCTGPASGRACSGLPRCFERLDPDRFVEGSVAWDLAVEMIIYPIIDCMKILCREGRKERRLRRKEMPFWNYSPVSDNSVLSIDRN
jgi:hypothetical protein